VPLERAEIYFLGGARGMLESGDYLVPRYQGEDFFDKPPLTYWLMAEAFGLWGSTPASGRRVSALAGLGLLLTTVWLGTRLLGRRAALAGGLVLLTTLAVISFARLAMSDMLLTLASTLAMALGLAAWERDRSRLFLPLLGLVLGLGFLTKGPIALLLPGLGLLLWAWRRRAEPPPLDAVAVALAALLFACAGLGWFVLIYARLGWAPLEHFFLRENLQRFAGETYDSGHGPWYYLGTYLAEGAPWSLLLPPALWSLRWRDANASGGEGARVLAGWVGLMLVPLSLSRGKLDYYLLPLYPPLSLLIGRYITEVPWRRADSVWARVVVLLLAAGLVTAVLMPSHIPKPWLPAAGARLAVSVAALLGAAALLAVAARLSAGRLLAALASVMALICLVLVWLFLPAFRAQQPNLAIARDVIRERTYKPDLRLVLCSDPARVQRDILFQTGLVAEERCDLWSPASAPVPFLLLVSQDELASLGNAPGIRVVQDYRYLPATAITLEGLFKRYPARGLALIANFPTDDPVAVTRARHDKKSALREPQPDAASEP
jgi:4-amino-4-deoxy-L-arabinose transferase-like glycosyltransferase